MSPLSYSAITPGNLELTPCRVTYKNVDLGATLSNVSVKIEEALAELKADQLGSTVIDKKVSGFKATIETELAETQLKANWKVVFPAHKLVVSGSDRLFLFDSQVGLSMLSIAGALKLHPLSRADADLAGDILIYKATAQGKADYEYSPSAQNKLKVIWDVYPDFTTTPPRFLIFGDPAIGVTAATAGSATAGSNTGNGSVGSIAVNNGYTQTETITLLALDATHFQVSGSNSGQLGVATISVAFSASQIGFTITAGGTAFVANDSFTIATVAANYS